MKIRSRVRRGRTPGLPASGGKNGASGSVAAGSPVSSTSIGRSTPSTRGALRLRSSRTQYSSLPMSTHEFALATPIMSAHPRIVPARDVAALDQREQLALAHQRVVERQPRELVLVRPRVPRPGVVEHPVVNLAVVLELERAD